MLKNDILNYAKQFAYVPEVKNANNIGEFESVVIGGMGGSGLPAGLLRAVKPEFDITAHHEYGLPKFIEHDKERRLLIAISHSGNTEETIDFCKTANDRGFKIAVIASKGKLLDIAEAKGLPYIDLPGDDVQPRMSLGYMLRAILKLIGEEDLYEEAGGLTETLKPEEFEGKGKELAEKLFGHVPIIYASRDNQLIGYNWKIKFNETSKSPAFYNTFPELNHNEMQGFDVADSTRKLSENLHFIFLEDENDYPRIRNRMNVTAKLYDDRGLKLERVSIEGKTKLEKIFNTLTLGDWTAYYLAKEYGNEPEKVPMVVEFKKLIR